LEIEMILDEFYGEFRVNGVTLQEALSVKDGQIIYKVGHNNWERMYGECEQYENVKSVVVHLCGIRRRAVKHFEERGISFEELPK